MCQDKGVRPNLNLKMTRPTSGKLSLLTLIILALGSACLWAAVCPSSLLFLLFFYEVWRFTGAPTVLPNTWSLILGLVMLGLYGGALTGGAQQMVLAPYLRPAFAWVRASIMGWLIGLSPLLVALVNGSGNERPTISEADMGLAFVLVGLSVSGAQWLTIRTQLRQGWGWVSSGFVSSGLAGLVWVYGAFPQSPDSFSDDPDIISLALRTITAGAIWGLLEGLRTLSLLVQLRSHTHKIEAPPTPQQ